MIHQKPQPETSELSEQSDNLEEPQKVSDEFDNLSSTSESSEDSNDMSKNSESTEEANELSEMSESSKDSNDIPNTSELSEDSNELSETLESQEDSNDLLDQDVSDKQSSKENYLENKSEENDFDDLMDNYEDTKKDDSKTNNSNQLSNSPSSKLNDISTSKVYKVFKKLVSLSYERYQKGTYKYNKKEIVKHYLTNQKFRIIDDLVSPTYKPDVYVFDLSPSNDSSLQMYINAISSVAFKGSLIYLTFNDNMLRKIMIKKSGSKNINIQEMVHSNDKKYNYFDCFTFQEYRSLYEELKNIRDRKIYIFSDFDISEDISKLSQINPEIVWFSTEYSNNYHFFDREYPELYKGYYVDTSSIEDIEKFVQTKDKRKYKRRSI